MTTIVDPAGEAARLIRSDTKGRVLVAADQRDALLDAFEQSGQSAMAFCRQHCLKYPTFATWVQSAAAAADRLFPGSRR
jgi:class 3 adenylate cyclase